MNLVTPLRVKIIRHGNKLPGMVSGEHMAPDSDLVISSITVNERYPLKGKFVNVAHKMFAQVLGGSGYIVIDGIRGEFFEGDVAILNHGEVYHWESDTGMNLLIKLEPKYKK